MKTNSRDIDAAKSVLGKKVGPFRAAQGLLPKKAPRLNIDFANKGNKALIFVCPQSEEILNAQSAAPKWRQWERLIDVT